jgi:hypothetical protein
MKIALLALALVLTFAPNVGAYRSGSGRRSVCPCGKEYVTVDPKDVKIRPRYPVPTRFAP